MEFNIMLLFQIIIDTPYQFIDQKQIVFEFVTLVKQFIYFKLTVVFQQNKYYTK